MVFSSNLFLFLFLPLTLTGYYLICKPYRNFFLLIMSMVFYASGEPEFIFIMAGLILFDYCLALLIDRFRKQKKLCTTLMVLCLIGNLGLLFTYKYLDFLIVNLNSIGFELPLLNLLFPLGISFFTFQAMSYVIDVYRESSKVRRNLVHVSLYIALFPQLIAGPIVRFKDIENQLKERGINLKIFSEGVRRFLIGLCKKILLANNLALIADHAFGLPDGERSVIYAWLGAIAYAFQILFDFSGYSDMAIGLGLMFGFRFPENFNYPYLSASVSEFWRRWHMTLGQWFRDYIYFPLGGSRVSTKGRLIFNLFVVWLLTGIWHGAGWNFMLWGLMYFVLIAFEKFTGYPQKYKTMVAKVAYRIFTMLAVLAGWVIFRTEGIQEALGYGLSMLAVKGNPMYCNYVIMGFREYWLFLLVGLLCCTRLPARLSSYFDSHGTVLLRLGTNVLRAGFYLFCFLWAVSFLVLGAHNPFIYFDF